jgi:hypothetical protein
MKHSAVDRALAIARARAREEIKPSTLDRRKVGPWDRRSRKADGGGVDDWVKPPFDPSKPFKAGPPPFEATQPVAADDRVKPPFDPSKPFRPLTDEEMGLPRSGSAAGIKWDDPNDGIKWDKDKPGSDSLSSLALQVPTGANETLANGLRAPVGAMTWALNHIPGVKIKDPVMGSDFIKRGMGLIGANPDNAPANTAAERIARGTGSGIAYGRSGSRSRCCG